VTADLFTRATGETLPCLDADRDGIADPQDNCPLIANGDQADADTDGIGDACDNCPAEPNPGQEDASGEAGVGDACDCPCFTRSDVADLLAQTSDPAVYGEPICIDTDPENKPLTAISVLRLDGAACSDGSQDCSAVAQAFTEDDACQLNPPLPATSVLLQGISAGQRDACSDYIRDGAAAAGLPCL
jgi:hypothetical protein